jgi:ribose transport system substrate-binding protein
MTITTIPIKTLQWLTLVLLTITGTACGGRHQGSEVYYLVATNTKIDYWQEAAAGLSAAARQMGVRAEIIGPETYDAQAEKDLLIKAAHQNVTPAGFLVSAADPELMRAAIDSAMEAGIPVVTIDSDSPKSKRLLFIGTNNYQAGQTGGEILANGLKGKGDVVVFTIAGQNNLYERLEGYKRALAGQPGIKISNVIDIRGEATKAFDTTKDLLEKKTVPDAFACLEALSCSEVADVLDRAGVKGKTIVAMDTNDTTLEWIRKGMIRATIAQKPYTMAFYGLHLVDDLHHNKTTATQGNRSQLPVFIDTGTTVVDKSNVEPSRASAR